MNLLRGPAPFLRAFILGLVASKHARGTVQVTGASLGRGVRYMIMHAVNHTGVTVISLATSHSHPRISHRRLNNVLELGG
jgi:hypothetical protein